MTISPFWHTLDQYQVPRQTDSTPKPNFETQIRSVLPFIFLITSFPIFAIFANRTCLSSLSTDSMDLAKAVEFPDAEAEWCTARTMLVDDDAAAL